MFLTTSSGRAIALESIEAADIDIQDIAHSLSNLCRFGGHTKRFYSVAQHSVRVALSLPKEHQLAGLLHDATEAYLVDIPRPLKMLLPDYQMIEESLWMKVAQRFGLDPKLANEVIEADNRALLTEWQELMVMPVPQYLKAIKPLPNEKTLSPPKAREYFLEAYATLRCGLPLVPRSL